MCLQAGFSASRLSSALCNSPMIIPPMSASQMCAVLAPALGGQHEDRPNVEMNVEMGANAQDKLGQCPDLFPGIAKPPELAIVMSSYVVRDVWAKGYVVDVSVVIDCLNSACKNRFGVDGFRIAFDLDDGAEIVKTWNAKLSRQGSVCTVYHAQFCNPVHNAQAVLYFGFEARLDLVPPRRSSQVGLPRVMTINGQVCGVQSCFARDLASCRNDYLQDELDKSDKAFCLSSSVAAIEPDDSSMKKEPCRRRRCDSAPPVLYTFFGLATSPRRGEEDESHSHLSTTTSVCADSENGHCAWSDDEDQSEAETVRDRGTESEVEEDSIQNAVPTPPLNIPHHSKNHECVHAASHKRKNFEEDETDHCGVCSESQAQEVESWSSSARYPKTLQVDYYRRSAALKKRKYMHMDYLDTHFKNREQVILNSVLSDISQPIVLEPNMFPYDTPFGVTHWTLWSRTCLPEQEVDEFVTGWLGVNLPEASEWNHDDNMADGLSINLFHLHVYVRCPVETTKREK